MIGQRELVKKIDQQVNNDKFPKFAILIGERGSGRKTLVEHISKKLDAMMCLVGIGVDDVRKVIENAYSASALKIVYLIADADNMSPAAANALLKVVEEPPENAYFIITCENLENLLPTIKSRGVTYMIEPYTYEDKCDYIDSQFCRLSSAEQEFILNTASNIGDIAQLLKINLKSFIEYVNLVVDNIAKVSGSNSFKIGDKLAIKDEDDKYDLRLFFKAFDSICVDRMIIGDEDSLRYGRSVAVTGDYLQQLLVRGINKQMLVDSWIIDIRDEWL